MAKGFDLGRHMVQGIDAFVILCVRKSAWDAMRGTIGIVDGMQWKFIFLLELLACRRHFGAQLNDTSMFRIVFGF